MRRERVAAEGPPRSVRRTSSAKASRPWSNVCAAAALQSLTLHWTVRLQEEQLQPKHDRVDRQHGLPVPLQQRMPDAPVLHVNVRVPDPRKSRGVGARKG